MEISRQEHELIVIYCKLLMVYTLLMAKKHLLDEQLHHDNSQLVWHVLF